jgi:uncharacterized protein Veg
MYENYLLTLNTYNFTDILTQTNELKKKKIDT